MQAQVVGDTLHIQVTDEGYGIDLDELEEHRQRLRHFRLDAQTVRHVGLPVVGRIASRLGITVNLRSTKGEGTRVDLNLPARLFHVAEPEPAARPALPWQPTVEQVPTRAVGPATDLPYGHADPAATAPFSTLTTTAPAAVLAATQEMPYAGRPPASVAPHHHGASAPTVIFDQLASANLQPCHDLQRERAGGSGHKQIAGRPDKHPRREIIGEGTGSYGAGFDQHVDAPRRGSAVDHRTGRR